MTFEILFGERAQADYESSVRWYLLQSKQAGIKFVRTVENALISISKNPIQFGLRFTRIIENLN